METIVLFWLTGYYDRYSTSSDQRPSRTHRDSDDTLLGQRTQPEAINEWGQKHYESSNEGIVSLHGTTNYHFISVCVYSKEMNYSICFLRNSVKFRFFSGFIFLLCGSLHLKSPWISCSALIVLNFFCTLKSEACVSNTTS